jgi:outer membrane lipoprotein-sorting protein
MDNIENRLSEYIDSLNAEKKPKEYEDAANPVELEKLAGTVRLIRSLKEPALPYENFSKKVARDVAGRLSRKPAAKNTRRAWFAGIAAIAAIVVAVVMLNSILPFGNINIVYAMEQAFDEVKAYHGILEIVGTNAQGIEGVQAKREVWADKEGRYYVKELEGLNKGLITVNNGHKKWQIRPDEKQLYIFSAFPDPYRFSFELGKEVDQVKNALETKIVGEDSISGRKASILEVSPSGGMSYRIWIDKETRLPLRKESGMYNSLQYRITYTEVDFADVIPTELISYKVPDGFKETDKHPEQLVNSLEEAGEVAGFAPEVPESLPEGYSIDSIAVTTDTKIIKLNYATQDNQRRVVILQAEATGEFKPASTAVLGKVGSNVAEIQSPIDGASGIITGGGPYAGVTGISSIRWQKDGLEYAIVGNVSVEELTLFVKNLTNDSVEIPANDEDSSQEPQVEVQVDLEVEENEQKSVDAGHSPWRLDPIYVAQVFVSLKISPEGIQGEYPVDYENLKIIKNDGKNAIVEVSGDKTPISKVYLKKLIRQDNTGIWTVVGYDPVIS